MTRGRCGLGLAAALAGLLLAVTGVACRPQATATASPAGPRPPRDPEAARAIADATVQVRKADGAARFLAGE